MDGWPHCFCAEVGKVMTDETHSLGSRRNKKRLEFTHLLLRLTSNHIKHSFDSMF